MNIFALSCIITAVFTAIMCCVVLLNNFRDKMNRAWFLTCVSIFVWIVGLYGTLVAGNESSALFWQRILYIGTILIPIFFFWFCLILLKKNTNNKSLFAGFILAGFFLVLSFSKLFIIGVKPRADFDYWPVHTGSFYPLFLIYFAYYVVYSVVLLKSASKKYTGAYQKQIQFVYYAALMGFGGGSTNFLLDFNINTYVIGNYFVIFYIIFISYAVFKHHLFNIKVIATELLAFTLWITLFIKIFVSDSPKDLILNICILLSVVVVGFWLIRSVIKEVEQKEEMKKMAEEVKRAYEVEKRANEELKKLDTIKNQFLMQTQHDLRTPLSIIRSYCDLIFSGTLGKQNQKTLDVAKRIQIVAEDKIRDVNNFLDTTQFQLGKKVVNLTPGIELNLIFQEIFNQLEPTAKSKGLYLKLENPAEKLIVDADREKLKSALFNIADNSVKYTENGGVAISLKPENGKIKIDIKDTGIGIPQDKIKTLFDSAFERSDEAKRVSPSGRGIGLYLSSQIIKAHNAKISVTSEGEGKGSAFTIELPVNM